jgi:hypothetical protein
MSRIEDALAKANKLRQSKDHIKKELETPPRCQSASRNEVSRWRYGIGILLTLAVGFSLYRYVAKVPHQPQPISPVTDASVNTNQAVPQPAPTKSLPQKNRLPSCILISTPDAAYSTDHPGWQKFKTESLEFLVFSEHGSIKAIQVISRKENAITDNFFATFLTEAAGKETFKVKSEETLDGYFIERGTAGNAANVVIYRKKPAEEILALVVAYI